VMANHPRTVLRHAHRQSAKPTLNPCTATNRIHPFYRGDKSPETCISLTSRQTIPHSCIAALTHRRFQDALEDGDLFAASSAYHDHAWEYFPKSKVQNFKIIWCQPSRLVSKIWDTPYYMAAYISVPGTDAVFRWP
jgi:hypothetical protein